MFERSRNGIAAAVAAICLGWGGPSAAAEMIEAEILNFSEMNRWVQVTDLICKTELYKDTMDAQARLPVELCTGDDGLAKVMLYVRIGCTKNQTFIKEGVENGATVSF